MLRLFVSKFDLNEALPTHFDRVFGCRDAGLGRCRVRTLLENIMQEALGCNIISDERLNCSKIRLGQVLHELGAFERFLNLIKDAAGAGTHLLELADEGCEAPTAVHLALQLSQSFIRCDKR